ncbi:MAG: beta-ketoacyl reductase [Planktothrix sp. GU0601_MAG3]|nr:MAG: beta-ketoacyl reductase [Planktothrix sp. GU0601_MAG3]
MTIQAAATYLITGGIGHLGLALAGHLVDLGAKHLILTTRRPFPPGSEMSTEFAEILENLRILEQKGASVEVCQADVGDFSQMQAIWAKIEKTAYPLRGVFHLAGVSGRQAQLSECTFADLQTVFQAKVQGSWNLHRLSLATQLDYFVLFSSAGAVWGAKQQGLYDAVSNLMDSLAIMRRLQGLPATTLNWALLAGNGIVSPEYEDWLKQIGMKEIELDRAFSVMDAIIESNETQILVADIDWVHFRNIYEFQGDKPLLKRLGQPQNIIKSVQDSSSTRRLLEDITPGERREHLFQYIGQQVGIILGIKQMPDPEQGFSEMGIDSLLSIELKNRLEKGLEVTLPASLVFDFPNIRRLVDYLIQQVLGWQVQTIVQTTVNSTEVQQDVDADLILRETGRIGGFFK